MDLKDVPISIDHFVPWSYVAHDELWNLTPTIRSVNSSKNNFLPNWDRYFIKLSDLEYRAYQVSQANAVVKVMFEKCLDEYVNDMSIRGSLYRTDQTREEFCNRLKEIVEPVYVAAKNLGFSEWRGPNE